MYARYVSSCFVTNILRDRCSRDWSWDVSMRQFSQVVILVFITIISRIFSIIMTITCYFWINKWIRYISKTVEFCIKVKWTFSRTVDSSFSLSYDRFYLPIASPFFIKIKPPYWWITSIICSCNRQSFCDSMTFRKSKPIKIICTPVITFIKSYSPCIFTVPIVFN